MSGSIEKLKLLRGYLLADEYPSGAYLLVYPPEEELAFRAGYQETIQEIQARNIPHCIIDLRTLVFDVLESRNLLEKAFTMDAGGSQDIHRSLAHIVQNELLKKIQTAATEYPDAILFCQSTAALFPWVSYAELLGAVENKLDQFLVIPFPGKENGPVLHFLGVKDGYNYRAGRI
jgi:hypothetical protein